MSKPFLYIFVGYPGAGKTTIAKIIHEETGAVHLWADRERQKMFGYPSHSQDESRQLYKALNIRAEDLLKDGKSVIFDTNFNYRRDRDLMRSIADRYGAKTVLVWVSTPRPIAKDRALHHTHRDRNGYLVSMSESEFDHLSDHLEEPEDDEHALKIDGTNIERETLLKQLH